MSAAPPVPQHLTAITFLAPNMKAVYRALLDHASRALNLTIDLITGSDYAQAADAELCFICGLPYVLRSPPRHAPIMEPLVAPVLNDPRCAGRPVYYSDVIVRRNSDLHTFDDLRGCRWAFNEPESQSGCGITLYTLLQRGVTPGFFGEVIEAGFHQRAISMVIAGDVDAAAIDWQVLAVERRNNPALYGALRVIDSFGPSSIQPLTAARRLDPALKDDLRAVLSDPATASALHEPFARGLIAHFVPVTDADYDDIRAMWSTCEQAGFTALR